MYSLLDLKRTEPLQTDECRADGTPGHTRGNVPFPSARTWLRVILVERKVVVYRWAKKRLP